MDKRISIKLNGNRLVTGRLRGFDHFMNVVVDEAVEEASPVDKIELGTIVRSVPHAQRNEPLSSRMCLKKPCYYRYFCPVLQVIRGNSVVQLECLDRIHGP